ncbi:phosphoenolpyruvate carboxykinase (ATP) [Clostridium beijerinckii]|uniref:phosphoenolpyruvate carboxykinase (ATP) n=1 Tax=Clostridium beijerinckii TaxID=1520 RepID=UPI00098CE441|nr:phosphoenolpyruvate carboxykinase (ATP) [Clostridium beijerinckii]NRT76048.1 phosphoenolpyruvate carboxykinase (ATP) [Clostridium beijerinckii]OOM44022.1 phosphoenolpyruvate carboxykinase [Clostridium beijerinckii]
MNINLDYLNIRGYNKVYRNISIPNLIEFATKRGEGVLSDKGALVVNTGKYTGRSPKDRFIVKDDITKDTINWGEINLPIDENVFDKIYNDVTEYLKEKDLFVFDGFVGALKEYTLPIRVVCECAYQAMFANQMFVRPTAEELSNHMPEFNVISAPGFKAKGIEDGINSEAFVLVNFSKKIVLIGGTAYSGEIKKSMFSIMNFLLPQKGVLPMHCSANKGEDGKTVVFFGLSGTGKTTLSTDPERKLIGDDEHGWCSNGVFNFEGGCYAKAIGLDKEKEKEIYGAVKFGAILENVVLNGERVPDYKDNRYTENTRAAYPLHHIENIEESGAGSNPSKIIFLTADATGVMPPVSKLSKEAAMYHFMSGYTSKVAGTERGITEPKATFSACFGEPFMLLNPVAYAKLLGEKINECNTEVYLINTGWIGGAYGIGKRINLSYTREMVNAVINDQFKNVQFYEHPIFKLFIPSECPNVPSEILNPKDLWEDTKEYDKKALELAESFEKNFEKFKNVSEDIARAGMNSEAFK